MLQQVEVLQGWLATLPLAVGDVEVPLQAYANKSFVLLMTEKVGKPEYSTTCVDL